MASLRGRLEQLIHSTRWDEAKQRQWLRKHGRVDTWGEASTAVIRKAIKKLEFADKAIDYTIAPVHDGYERDALDAYRDD